MFLLSDQASLAIRGLQYKSGIDFPIWHIKNTSLNFQSDL